SLQKRLPKSPRILEALIAVYSIQNRNEESLHLAQRLITMLPHEPDTWYLLGSCYAAAGYSNEAIAALTKALNMGYSDIEWMQQDEDLLSLRADPRFQKLLNKARQKTPYQNTTLL
ncbi:MAG: hypothetical protein V2A34_16595, partial [Lentisphaerota bacterium]